MITLNTTDKLLFLHKNFSRNHNNNLILKEKKNILNLYENKL